MRRELTEADIEKLYAFTQKKFVDTYDVQTELVDHLASDIERQWEENPDLTLEEALQQVYSKFGIFGFSEVFEERVAAIKKESKLQWLRTFLTFFKLPYLVFSLLLLVSFQVALTTLDPDTVKLVALVLLTAGVLVGGIKEYLFQTRNLRKKLTIMQYNYPYGLLLYFPLYINYGILEHFVIDFESTWPYALHITTWYILAFAYFATVKKIKQKAQKLYPAAFA